MKKFLSIIALSAVLAFTGCGSSDAETETSAENTQEETSKVVTDVLGREIEVPAEIEDTIALGAGALRMLCYAGVEDKVIGIEEGEVKPTLAKGYNFINNEKFKDLPLVGSGGGGSYTPYTEEIITLAPDVIFASYPQDLAEDLQAKTGIPVVVVTYKHGMFDPMLYQSMDIIGDIMGVEDRCTEVVDALKGWEMDIDERTKDIPDEEKPRVFTGACSFSGGHGIEGTYTQYPPFLAANINNVADEVRDETGGLIVDLEQIAVWDPDIIFLDPNNMHFVNDDYALNKDFYDSLRAVQEGNVYTQVAYNWYTTNVETAVVDSYYAGKIVYPEAFEDVDIESIAREIYTTMLGENAETYYDDLVAGGLGWSQITLGE